MTLVLRFDEDEKKEKEKERKKKEKKGREGRKEKKEKCKGPRAGGRGILGSRKGPLVTARRKPEEN